MADKEPWFNLPISIGGFGEGSKPWVDSSLSVGPYVGPGADSVPRGIAALKYLAKKYGPAAQAKGRKRSRGKGSKEARDNPLGVLRALHSSLTDVLSSEPIVAYRPPDRPMPGGRLLGPDERASSGRGDVPMVMETGVNLRPAEDFQGPPTPDADPNAINTGLVAQPPFRAAITQGAQPPPPANYSPQGLASLVTPARLPSGRGGDVPATLDTGLNLRPAPSEQFGPPIPSSPPVTVGANGPALQSSTGILSVLNPTEVVEDRLTRAYPTPAIAAGTPTAPYEQSPSVAAGTPLAGYPDVVPGATPAPLPEEGRSISNFFSDLWKPIHPRVYPPDAAGGLAGRPMPEEVWQAEHQGDPAVTAGNILIGDYHDRSRGHKPTLVEDAVDPLSVQKVVDAAPYRAPPITTKGTQQVPYSHFGPELPGATVVAPDASTPPSEAPSTDPNAPVTDPTTDPNDPNYIPPIDTAGLPGSQEASTGALSFDDYLVKIQKAYPDLDFSNNPKQALADANAKRDLDRTALLAQLSLAAGMVSGAGKSWEGIGAGFADAGKQYGEGFKRYQDALQSAADRYADQQDKRMTYDMARRKAALDLFSDAETRRSEDARTLWKAREDRKWDVTKLLHEDQQAGLKRNTEVAQHLFDKELELMKPTAENPEPLDAKKVADFYDRMERGMKLGHYIPPGSQYDVADQ
jgi:hypothetical protein